MAAQKPRAWLNSEVKTFLCLLAEDRIQTELIESTRNERIFKEISERMATCGYQRTPKQCREKLKKLKCDYRSLIDHNGVRGPNRKTWKWFDEMDAIYGHRAENNGREIGLDAASAQLESSIDNATMERSGRVGVTRWSHVETQALLAAWSEDGIQRELEESNRNEAAYGKISARLAAAGVSRSANQCRNKMKKFKQDYRQLKQQFMSDETMTSETFEWFYAMDSVIKDRPAAAIDDSTDQMTLELMISDVQTDSPSATNSETLSTSSSAMSSSNPFGRTKVMPTCSWSRKEVLALLTHWANPAIQQELRWSKRNIAVFNRLSAKLATLGFSKTAHNCQEKLRHLKQNYRRIKNSNPSEGAKKMWFNIIDRVLGSQPAASECAETAPSSSAEPIAPVVFSLNTNDEADWLPDEVQVLVTLWAQPNIQRQLHASGTHSVFTYLSSELALIGFNKTPQQCNLKVNRLKEMYKTIKQVEPHRNNGSDWFSVMDGVLGPEAATSRDANSAAAVIAPESAEDSCQAAWTPEEVDALLTLWAEESFQEQLKSTEGDERVYAQLSSELATQGFDKTTYQCRTKIRLLEQEYERFKEEKDSKAQKSSWFVIMDEILGCPKLDAETDLAGEPLQASHPAEGCRLSVPSLCLLVPTLRLMCAFVWQVVRCGNVAQYNKVEELVSLVTELAPELLTARERAQLLLRLRARLVLELCRSERVADLLDVQSHLRIIQKLMTSSGCDQEELEKSKSNFVEVVHTLLGDPQERIRFFVEVFPIHYGQQYEAALQTLVWKFISRVDNLLPVPDIKQTADWLSSAPSVMEECGQLVLEREQLKELLHFHEQQTGINNKCFSQAQNVFLPLLHLRPKTNPRQRAASVVENEGFSCGKDESLDKSLTNDTAEDFGTINNLQDNQSEGNRFCSSFPSGSKPQHRCSMCSYSDSRMAALLQHIRQEHLVQKSSPFTGTKDHASLSGDVLKDIVTPGSQGPPFQCDQCDKTYLSKRYLIVHRRIHTGETPFLCSICGQGFRSSFILKTHMRTHTGERPYMCPICGKTSVQHLARHMRMHRGEKNYLCTECGKAFLSSGELRLHMRHHTGERPYTCRQCGKGFIAKCQLTVHTRQHTGERPYRCPLCPKAFYTLNYLKRHLKSHSKKSYQCLKCMKTFRQEDTFNLHVKTHDLV